MLHQLYLKTLEAIVLYHADELSAKTNAYKGAIIAEFDQIIIGQDIYL